MVLYILQKRARVVRVMARVGSTGNQTSTALQPVVLEEGEKGNMVGRSWKGGVSVLFRG